MDAARSSLVLSMMMLLACFGPNISEGLSCEQTGLCPVGQLCDPVTRTCHSEGAQADAAVVVPDASGADGPPPAVFCPPGTTDLLACYQFEDGFKDGSEYGHELVGNTTFSAGLDGLAMVVDNDLNISVTSDALDFTGAFAVEALVFSDGLANRTRYFVHRENHLGIGVTSMGIPFCAVGTNAAVAGGAAFPSATWAHVACVYSEGSEAILYVDGIAVGSFDIALPPTGSMAPLHVGGESGGDSDLVGMIDNVRVFSSTRTAEQVCAAAGALCTP